MNLETLVTDLWSAAYDIGIPGERFHSISMFLDSAAILPGAQNEREDLQFLAGIAAEINASEVASLGWEYA